jgi:hypothetical protein
MPIKLLLTRTNGRTTLYLTWTRLDAEITTRGTDRLLET